MSTLKIKQLQHESDTWKRALSFMREENIHLKNRLSEVLKSKAPKKFVARVEAFHNNFLRQDDLILLLRNDMAEFDQLLASENPQNNIYNASIDVKLKKLRNNISIAEEEFKRLKLEFNGYLFDNV